MIKCPTCAEETPDDAKFCVKCGAPAKAAEPVPPVADEAPAANKFCTSCGAKLVPGNKFCTGCGAEVGAPPKAEPAAPPPGQAAGAGGAPPATAQAYLETLDARLAAAGFEAAATAPTVLALDRWLRRKRIELFKGGMVTSFCAVKVLAEPATTAYVKEFSKTVYNHGNANKGFLAKNAFQQLLAYPVLVAPSVDAGVEAFLESYWPKHWMAYEYPVVVSIGTGQVLMHRTTPVWVALTHGHIKKEAEALFAL
jgi:hypothetical protein